MDRTSISFLFACFGALTLNFDGGRNVLRAIFLHATALRLLRREILLILGKESDERPDSPDGDEIKVEGIRQGLAIDLGEDEHDDE